MVAKKMERVLLIMWFVSLVFVCIIGYREIINAVPYGLEMASKIVSENNGMDGTLYQKILTEAIHCYQIVGALLVMLGGFGIIKSVCAIKEKHRYLRKCAVNLMAHFLCYNTIDIDVLDTSMKDFN